MKKLSLILVLLIYCNAAYAFPGDSEAKIKSWIQKHAFLSPYFYLKHEMDIDRTYCSYRQLQDGYFIDFCANIVSAHVIEDYLFLTKRHYEPDLDTSQKFDARKWAVLDTENIWNRDNQVAYELLKNVYDKKVADDFKGSKMVFSGVEYIEAEPTSYYRYKIKNTPKYEIKK